MTEGTADRLTEQFEHDRGRLRSVAYRMLGSLAEADDAVQEAWLRLHRAGTAEIDNLGGWLTTVVARVCLDMLRSRQSRREEPLEPDVARPVAPRDTALDPEQEALLADSVGLALLVVLDTLTPVERLAFVLHDMFAVSFEEIAPIVGKSPAAARQLASRARRRVRGAEPVPDADRSRQRHQGHQRHVVEAFLTALRAGDLNGLLAILDPDVVVRADAAAAASGAPTEIRGARAWAEGAIKAARGARAARVALVDGAVGLIVAPGGRLFRALKFTFDDGTIVAVDVVADPERIRRMEVALLETLG